MSWAVQNLGTPREELNLDHGTEKALLMTAWDCVASGVCRDCDPPAGGGMAGRRGFRAPCNKSCFFHTHTLAWLQSPKLSILCWLTTGYLSEPCDYKDGTITHPWVAGVLGGGQTSGCPLS